MKTPTMGDRKKNKKEKRKTRKRSKEKIKTCKSFNAEFLPHGSIKATQKRNTCVTKERGNQRSKRRQAGKTMKKPNLEQKHTASKPTNTGIG